MSTQQPSRCTTGLGLMLPDHWTPEQALAVVELLDDLRECIYAHYLISIQQALREDRLTANGDPDPGHDPEGVPF